MCGLFGFVGDRDMVDRSYLHNVMEHRGPENFSHREIEDNVFFAHSRLRITDPVPNSDQPMSTNNGRYCIIFNGELYNFKELNEKFCLNSVGDTQVLLQLISHLGVRKAVAQIKGMVAFAVYDSQKRKIHLYRDSVGKKPLYYLADDNIFSFGSEIKFFRQFSPTLDETFIFDVLRVGHSFGETTMFKNIKQLQPGSLLTYDLAQHNFKIDHFDVASCKTRFNAKEFEKKFNSAVKLRKNLEVKAVSFLSGGVDSSLVSSLLKENKISFSSFKSSENDIEISIAKKTAKNLGVKLDIEEESEMSLDYLINCLKHYDEPTIDLSYIFTCRLTSKVNKDTKVIFNGEGADELFLGYTRLRIMALFSLLNSAKLLWLVKLGLSFLTKIRPMSRSFTRLRAVIDADFEEAYIRANGDLLSRTELSALAKDGASLVFNDIDQHWRGFKLDRVNNKFSKLILADFFVGLRGGLMRKVDMATMQYSKEARSPFLDQELVQWALASSIYKRGLTLVRKKFVTKAARAMANRDLGRGKKVGFATKYKNFVEQYKEGISEIGLDCAGYVFKHLDHKKVMNYLAFQDPERKFKIIYMFFVINLTYADYK